MVDLEKGPVVMTCRNHNGGTNKRYIHPPRHPYHNLSSRMGDQLCHAVVKTRTVQSMKALKYFNRYKMVEQRVSFQGIDTCDVVDIGRFDVISVFLSESESMSIKIGWI